MYCIGTDITQKNISSCSLASVKQFFSNLFKNNFIKYNKNKLKDTLKVFDDFKNKQKNAGSNVFRYVQACIFWKRIQYTIHWDKTWILKKISFGQNKQLNSKKMTVFFLLQSPTHQSFTFNLWFLKELKHKIFLS